MSDFYTNLQNTALRLIKDKGRSLLLARLTKGTPNVVTGAPGGVTALTGVMYGIVLPLSSGDKTVLDASLTEALIRGDLRKILVAAKGITFEPAPIDVTDFDDAYWIFKSVGALNPAGTPLVYTVIVERTALTMTDIAALPA